MPHEPSLLHFCNEELRLSRKVASVEKDFASGKLFGEVLASILGLPQFKGLRDEDTTAAKLHNFGLLTPVFSRVGISLSDQQVQDVATEKAGAASSLLLKVRTFQLENAGLVRKSELESSSAVRGRTGAAAAAASGSPLHHPGKRSSSPRKKREIEDEDALPFAERLVASGMGQKQIAMELSLEKFDARRVQANKQVRSEKEEREKSCRMTGE